MNEESFKRFAASFIQPFEKYGFRIVAQDYQPANFGNAYAMFGDHFRLRLIRDRGQLFVEISPQSDRAEEWYDLRTVLEFLGDGVDMQAVDEASIDEVRIKLDARYETIRSLFSPDNFVSTKLRLDEFREQRVRKFLNLG